MPVSFLYKENYVILTLLLSHVKKLTWTVTHQNWITFGLRSLGLSWPGFFFGRSCLPESVHRLKIRNENLQEVIVAFAMITATDFAVVCNSALVVDIASIGNENHKFLVLSPL